MLAGFGRPKQAQTEKPRQWRPKQAIEVLRQARQGGGAAQTGAPGVAAGERFWDEL